MFEALLMGHDDWVFSVQWQKPFVQAGKMGILQQLFLDVKF